MPRIVVMASRAHSIGSAAIRAAQLGRAWSHTADVLTAGDYTDTIEALALRGGVVQDTVQGLRARSSEYISFALEVSPEQAAARDAWLLAQRGRGYDFGGAVFGAWWQWRQWQDPERWFCSELSASAAQRIGALHVSPYIKGVMPTTCVDLLLAAGWRVVER